MFTVVPQLFFSSLAVLFCVTLIVGLSLPLVLRKIRVATTAVSAAVTLHPLSSLDVDGGGGNRTRASRFRRTKQQHRQRSQQSQQQRQVSTAALGSWNLYLIYLAIPDIILNLYLLFLYGSITNQKLYKGFSTFNLVCNIDAEDEIDWENPFGPAFVLGCSTSSMYLNTIIAYEILLLLKDCHNRKRRSPPAFTRVTLQALLVYSWSITVFVIRFFISREFNNKASIPIFFMISAGIPIMVLMTICFIIWYRVYMPSIGGRMKELTNFFARIVLL